MTIFRAQLGFFLDSALPRDVQLITPHYTGTDAAGLASALKANLLALAGVGATTSFTVNIYNAQGLPPHHPLATQVNSVTPGTSGGPREVCLCLSYYATLNQPRTRGRVYLPNGLINGGAQLGVRPTTTMRSAALAWKGALSTGLPAGTVWVVYSRKNDSTAPVTNVWVNDEWDTVRSRGLRETARTLGTVP